MRTEEHRHCLGCKKPIPADARPPYCSRQCERIHDALMFGIVGAVFGTAAYIMALVLAANMGG